MFTHWRNKRSFFISKKEYLAGIRHLRFNKSALTKYVLDNEHSMDGTNAKILDFELDFTKRWFIELYFINQIPNTTNYKHDNKFPSSTSNTMKLYCCFSRSANLSLLFEFCNNFCVNVKFILLRDSLIYRKLAFKFAS